MSKALSDALPYTANLYDKLRLVLDGRHNIGEEEGSTRLEQRISLVEEERRGARLLLGQTKMRSFGDVWAVVEAYA